jgi:hypothetical protein
VYERPKITWEDVVFVTGRNTGKKWSKMDLFDLRHAIERGYKVPEIATFLMRTEIEVRRKALELGLKLPAVR